MLTSTHLAVTVLIVMLVRLNRDEWFLAIMFGVVVDADHLFALPRYVEANGWGAILRQSWDDGSGSPWRSLFHHPMSAFVVGHLSEGWRLLLPLPFWSIHLAMDWLQLAVSEHNTFVESVIFIGSVSGIVYLGYVDWSARTGRTEVRPFCAHVLSSARNWFANTRALIPRPGDRT